MRAMWLEASLVPQPAQACDGLEGVVGQRERIPMLNSKASVVDLCCCFLLLCFCLGYTFQVTFKGTSRKTTHFEVVNIPICFPSARRLHVSCSVRVSLHWSTRANRVTRASRKTDCGCRSHIPIKGFMTDHAKDALECVRAGFL